MIKDLLDFTQVRLGSGIPVKFGPANLHSIAQQVVDEVLLTFPNRELLLRRSGRGDGVWDADRLSQAISNLVLNAVKYSPAGSTVTVEARDEDDAAIVSVHNRGEPISPQLLPVIFNPMQRGSRDSDGMGRSIGLGLFIVKSIVDAHRGTIAARSNAEEGTTLTLRLPRQPRR
jgi:signal transduction histidine kinase